VVSLDILDNAGKLVRHLSNEEKKEAETPPEWPDQTPPAEKIPAVAGLNRFIWDLRGEGPTPLPGEPGAEDRNRGQMVPPGSYQVRLTAEGKSYTAPPFELKIDARIKVSDSDLQKQFELERKVRAEISEIHDVAAKMRDVRVQTRALNKRFADDPRFTQFLAAAKDFDKKSNDVESQLIQVNAKSSESNLNYPVLIDERLHGLLNGLDSDAAPTAQQLEVFDSLEKEAQPLLAQAHELLTKDVAALNDMVSKLNIPAIYVAEGK
jgi:hypothetical protein